MEQIVDTLPKDGNKRVKTTLENFIDKGIEIGREEGKEIGREIGREQGKEANIIHLVLEAIIQDLEISFITKLFKVPIKTIKAIQKCHKDHFKSKALRKDLATELLSTFQHLQNDDIAKFCHLNIEVVAELKVELLSED
jgi:predicted transposase YdaD